MPGPARSGPSQPQSQPQPLSYLIAATATATSTATATVTAKQWCKQNRPSFAAGPHCVHAVQSLAHDRLLYPTEPKNCDLASLQKFSEHLFQNAPTSIRRSSKIDPKLDQKSIQNGPWDHLGPTWLPREAFDRFGTLVLTPKYSQIRSQNQDIFKPPAGSHFIRLEHPSIPK